MQNKIPYNEQGRQHGYWEVYYNGRINQIANYVEGQEFGYYYYGYYHDVDSLEIYFAR